MNKKMNGFKNLITVLLILLFLGIAAGHVSAAADIVIDNARITSSNTVVVTFVAHGGNLTYVNQTRWHIDVNDGGINPLSPAAAAFTSFSSPYKITLTFAGTPFPDNSISYNASLGLYADAEAVKTSTSSNVIITHDNSIAIEDGQAPTLTITTSPTSPSKTKATLVYTFEFSENVTGFSAADLTLNFAGAGAGPIDGATFASTDANTYTLTLDAGQDATDLATLTTGQTVVASVDMTALTDIAANAGVGTTTNTWTYDPTAPTLTITTSPTSPSKTKTALVYTFEFSEDVTGFSSADITLNFSGAGAGPVDGATFVATDASTYTLTLDAGQDATDLAALTTGQTVVASVDMTALTDIAANAGVGATTNTWAYDTTAPTVALTYSANPAKAGAMTITATYSEEIVGTPAISINQSGSTDATAQAMIGGPTVWTYAYTVNTATGGSYIDGAANVSLSTVADAASNNAGAPTGTTFTIDTTAPTVALTYSANPSKSGAMTVTATYSEPIVGTPAISIDQPGSADITTQVMADSGDQTVWNYAYTVNTATGGTYIDGAANISLSTVADAATNNAGSPTGTTFTIDTIAPTVALTYSANPAKAGAMTIIAIYSEAIVGTPAISIDQPGSIDLTSVPMIGGPTVWSYAYTVNTANGEAYLDGSATVSLSTVADAASNNAGSPTGTTFTIDTIAPTVALTYSVNPAKAEAMTITATYSEAIVGTPAISIDQPGSTDITIEAMGGGTTVWTYAYTVNTATGGTYIDGAATVSLSTVSDAASNNAGSPTGTTFTIDTTAPTFTAARTAPNIILLTFSENVDVTTTAGEGYTLSSGTVIANTDPAGSSNTITLITSGVSGSPTVTYGAAQGTTVDTTRNEVADGFYAVSSSGSAVIIVVTANNSSPQVNGTVTINATIKDSIGIKSESLGTGTIKFLANGTEFASTNLSDGVASTTYTRATAGAVTITAFYNATLQNTTIVTFMPAALPALTVSASSANVTAGMPTYVLFNVTSNGNAKANATITLGGVATGSCTTNISGLAVINVNATSAGTITATANLSGYTNGATTINADEASILTRALLVSSITPNSRNVQLGTPVTLFISVINYGTATATGVSITQASSLPATVSYQQWDGISSLIGSANTPVDMVAGATAHFLLTINATSAFNSSSMTFNVSSTNGAIAPIGAVNTLTIFASVTPSADVIMISTNTTVNTPVNKPAFFALATMNVGGASATGGSLIVSVPSTITGLAYQVNQTNSTTGAIIGPATGLTIAVGDTPTFAVFLTPTEAITNDPANNRITLKLIDGGGKVIGAQSVAIYTT